MSVRAENGLIVLISGNSYASCWETGKSSVERSTLAGDNFGYVLVRYIVGDHGE